MMFFTHINLLHNLHKAAKTKERKENAVKISEEIMYSLCI